MGLFDGKPIVRDELPDTDAVPTGIYCVAISDVTAVKQDKKKRGFFGITYKIIEGEHKGRLIYDSYIVESGAALKEILTATEVKELKADELQASFLGKELMVKVAVVPGDRGDQNVVAKRSPMLD